MRRIYNIHPNEVPMASVSGRKFWITLAVCVLCWPLLVSAKDRKDDKVDARADYEYLRDMSHHNWPKDAAFADTEGNSECWWESFGDKTLDSLVTLGMQRNYDIFAATRRIRIARLQMDQTRSGYMPNVGLDAGWTKGQSSGLMMSDHGKATQSSYFNAGLSVSWEIDVFGRISKQMEQDRASWRASQADYAATMLALQAEIVTEYITIRSYQAQLEVAQQQSADQKKIETITQTRMDVGLASLLDVSQAKSVYFSTMASVPTIENSIRCSINALAILLGEYPQDLYVTMEPVADLPDFQRIINKEVPMQLIRRRPDIAQAEQEVQGNLAAMGIAKKDYLPVFSINGSIGTEAHSAKKLFNKESYYWSVAPTLSWTLFDGMKRRYAVESAKMQVEASIANYNEVVLTAFEEVENAMSTYEANVKYYSAMEETLFHTQKALELSLEQYKNGLIEFSTVVNAQKSVLSYRNALVSAQTQALTALVDLYKALGGGFSDDAIL